MHIGAKLTSGDSEIYVVDYYDPDCATPLMRGGCVVQVIGSGCTDPQGSGGIEY